jgi:hypothetical protein
LWELTCENRPWKSTVQNLGRIADPENRLTGFLKKFCLKTRNRWFSRKSDNRPTLVTSHGSIIWPQLPQQYYMHHSLEIQIKFHCLQLYIIFFPTQLIMLLDKTNSIATEYQSLPTHPMNLFPHNVGIFFDKIIVKL